jgi:hypothetical protein
MMETSNYSLQLCLARALETNNNPGGPLARARQTCFVSVMIGKLFLTLATLALLHGMNVLSDI